MFTMNLGGGVVARIKCVMCGKKISTSDDVCPKCSFPVEQSLREEELQLISGKEEKTTKVKLKSHTGKTNSQTKSKPVYQKTNTDKKTED